MKNLLLFILLCFLSLFAQAQATKHYVVLDSAYNPHLDYSHIVSEYHGYPIEQFNIFLNKNKSMIALLSVLKPFSEKEIQWEPIDLGTIKNQIITTDSLTKYMNRVSEVEYSRGRLDDGISSMKHRNYYPVIKKGNKYYTPKIAVNVYSLELFFTADYTKDKDLFYETVLYSKQPFYHINLSGQVMAIKAFEQMNMEKFGKYSNNYPEGGLITNIKSPFLIRELDTLIHEKKAYRFWTLGNWSIDSYHLERGIERLTYVPEYGIVAGAYTAYFINKTKRYFQRQTTDVFAAAGISMWNPVEKYINYDYLHNIQSTPLRIEVNGNLMYEKQ